MPDAVSGETSGNYKPQDHGQQPGNLLQDHHSNSGRESLSEYNSSGLSPNSVPGDVDMLLKESHGTNIFLQQIKSLYYIRAMNCENNVEPVCTFKLRDLVAGYYIGAKYHHDKKSYYRLLRKFGSQEREQQYRAYLVAGTVQNNAYRPSGRISRHKHFSATNQVAYRPSGRLIDLVAGTVQNNTSRSSGRISRHKHFSATNQVVEPVENNGGTTSRLSGRAPFPFTKPNPHPPKLKRNADNHPNVQWPGSNEGLPA
ncbi:hypothetical protein L9F63_001876, partial [Diploptera punctata]